MALIQQTVFIVDDDPSIRRTLPRALKRRGYVVEAFGSAQAFLNSYAINKAGCLVLDLSMPGMDRLELQKVLQQRGFTIPIIFITGHGGVPESVKAVRAGAIDFLEKPFAPERLIERIEEAFNQDAQARAKETQVVQLRKRFDRLTSREQEILDCLLAAPETVSSKSIAKSLGISHRTVEQHRARILQKTQTSSLPDLVILAQKVGITTGQNC